MITKSATPTQEKEEMQQQIEGDSKLVRTEVTMSGELEKQLGYGELGAKLEACNSLLQAYKHVEQLKQETGIPFDVFNLESQLFADQAEGEPKEVVQVQRSTKTEKFQSSLMKGLMAKAAGTSKSQKQPPADGLVDQAESASVRRTASGASTELPTSAASDDCIAQPARQCSLVSQCSIASILKDDSTEMPGAQAAERCAPRERLNEATRSLEKPTETQKERCGETTPMNQAAPPRPIDAPTAPPMTVEAALQGGMSLMQYIMYDIKASHDAGIISHTFEDINEGQPFKVQGFLGQGGWGDVWDVRHRRTGKRFALKRIDMAKLGKPGLERLKLSTWHEELVLAVLQVFMAITGFRGVNRSYGTILTQGNLYLVLEFCGITAHKLASLPQIQELAEQQPAVWFQFVTKLGMQLVESLYVLRSNHMVDRDIKPENMMTLGKYQLSHFDAGHDLAERLLEADWTLVDFSTARLWSAGENSAAATAPAGATDRYAPPEVLLTTRMHRQGVQRKLQAHVRTVEALLKMIDNKSDKFINSIAFDVYSVALVLLELFTKAVPEPLDRLSKPFAELMQNIAVPPQIAALPDWPKMLSALERMLHLDPTKRATVDWLLTDSESPFKHDAAELAVCRWYTYQPQRWSPAMLEDVKLVVKRHGMGAVSAADQSVATAAASVSAGDQSVATAAASVSPAATANMPSATASAAIKAAVTVPVVSSAAATLAADSNGAAVISQEDNAIAAALNNIAATVSACKSSSPSGITAANRTTDVPSSSDPNTTVRENSKSMAPAAASTAINSSAAIADLSSTSIATGMAVVESGAAAAGVDTGVAISPGPASTSSAAANLPVVCADAAHEQATAAAVATAHFHAAAELAELSSNPASAAGKRRHAATATSDVSVSPAMNSTAPPLASDVASAHIASAVFDATDASADKVPSSKRVKRAHDAE